MARHFKREKLIDFSSILVLAIVAQYRKTGINIVHLSFNPYMLKNDGTRNLISHFNMNTYFMIDNLQDYRLSYFINL